MMMCSELLAVLMALAGIRNEAILGTGSILGSGAGSGSRTSLGSTRGDAASGIISGTGSFFGGNSAQSGGNTGTISSQPDAMYLIVKVDLISSGSTNITALNQPLLNEVEQLLATGFPEGTFQLAWVTYEESKKRVT